MSTLVNSFMQGSGFVRGKNQQVLDNKRDATLDKMRGESHRENIETSNLQQQRSGAEFDEFKANAGNRATLNTLAVDSAGKQNQALTHTVDRQGTLSDRVDEDHKTTTARKKVLADRQDDLYDKTTKRTATLDKRDDDQYKRQIKQQKEADNIKWLQERTPIEKYNAMNGKGLTMEYYKRSQETGFDISGVLDGQTVAALDLLVAAADPQDKRVSPTDGRFIPAFNVAFGNDLNKGKEQSFNASGSPAENKELISVHPVMGEDGQQKPGKFYGNLLITYEDGTTAEQPMTEGRDSNPDAKMKEIDLEQFIDQVGVRRAYLRAWSQPEVIADLRKFEASKKPKGKANGKEMVMWKGQSVNTEQLQKQFNENEKLSRFLPDGQTALYGWEDYLWTGGDPDKMKVLRQIAQLNRPVAEKNIERRLDGEPEMPLLDLQKEYSKEVKKRKNGGEGADVNSELLNELLKDKQQDNAGAPPAPPAPLVDNPVVDDAAVQAGPDVLYKTVKTGRHGHFTESNIEVPKFITKGTGPRGRTRVKVLNPDYASLLQEQQGEQPPQPL